MSIEAARGKIRIGKNAAVQRNGSLDAFDHEHLESALHAADRFGTVAAFDDKLGDHRIVVRWNHSISVSGGIDTHAGAAWRLKSGDAASRRNKSLGIFGVDAALDGVPGKVNFTHGVVELIAGCDSNLGLDEIRTRDEFGDRMFNLNTRG